MQVQNWNYVTNLNDEYVETKFIRRLYSSVDGFPGDVIVSISYRLNNNNRLTILFEAFEILFVAKIKVNMVCRIKDC